MLIALVVVILAVLLSGAVTLGLWVAGQIQRRDEEARFAAQTSSEFPETSRPEPRAPREPHAPKGETKLTGLELLLRRDPGFSPHAFLARAKAARLKMQDCGERRDYAAARSFLSDGQAECWAIRLELDELSGRSFSASEFELQSAEIRTVESDRFFDAVHVSFTGLRRLDEIATRTGAPITAGPQEAFHEVWTFVRRPGRATLDKPGLIEGFCPNCGAPVELTDAGRCASCSSWLNSGEYDWVLTKTTDAKYWTPVSQLTRDPGLELLGQADPESNVHFLEDRVLLAFWRWRLAAASRAAAPLAAVATAEFSAREAAELASAPPAPGGVVVEDLKFSSFRFGDPRDTAAFRVRWSGWEGLIFAAGDPQRRWVTKQARLSLIRKNGTLTAPRSGLCSARCHACGAPPSRRDLAACEYCGAPFNDGGCHWTLSDLA